MQYVCGFLFDQNLEDVLLITKLAGPVGMAGKLNGVGGKIEGPQAKWPESPVGAMRRKFREEVGGFDERPILWKQFHKMRHQEVHGGNGATVFFYTARTDILSNAYAREREDIGIYPWREVAEEKSCPPGVYNLVYLLPMAHVYLKHPEHRWIEG